MGDKNPKKMKKSKKPVEKPTIASAVTAETPLVKKPKKEK